MKNYTITVNGNVYDVTVEETGSTSGAAAPRRTAAKPAAAPAAPAASAGAGNIKIEAGAAGKVFKIEKKVGDAVKRGQNLLVLEAMKMENNIDADRAGVVKQILVQQGATVMEGDVLIVIG